MIKFMIELLLHVDYFDNKFAFPQRGCIQNHMELLVIPCMILFLMHISIFEGERNLTIGGGEVSRWVLHLCVFLCALKLFISKFVTCEKDAFNFFILGSVSVFWYCVYICVCVCVCMFVSNICAYNIYMHIVVNCLVAKLCPTLRPYGL